MYFCCYGNISNPCLKLTLADTLGSLENLELSLAIAPETFSVFYML